ncbi:MAG: superoxide dismutase [Muribaculaceae bacterium]|nr:superoxide dismutase [Muribaculaceae bacterium]
MIYTLPDLPYMANALEPAVSQRTIEYHYGKHEKAYVDNLNRLIKGTEFEDMPLEDIICQGEGALLNNAAQAWNHIFYFFSLSPDGGGEPQGELRAAIDNAFGSFDAFKDEFVRAGVSLFGAGWVWLATDEDGKLSIVQGKNADNPLRQGLIPLLAFDVWEHAYYLDWQNRREDALKALWQFVDWSMVEQRFA